MSNKTMTRKAFIKSLGVSVLGILFTLRSLKDPIVAEAGVTDNVSLGVGVTMGNSAPSNPNTLWVNPNEDESGKYYNGTEWRPFTSRSYVKSMQAPKNKATIWLNESDGALYYNDGESWVPINALWG